MRKSILFGLLVLLPMAAIASYAVECFSYEPFDQAWGFSSDEEFGGGSYLGVDTRDVTSDRLGDLKDRAGKLYAHATTTCMIFPAKG